jgi:hypothetical protein
MGYSLKIFVAECHDALLADAVVWKAKKRSPKSSEKPW